MAKKEASDAGHAEAMADSTTSSDATTSSSGTKASIGDADRQKAAPLKRVSIRNTFGDVKAWWRGGGKVLVENSGGSLLLCRIFGRVVKTSVGSNNFGEFVRFHGEFYGVSARDSLMVKAAQCVLPKWLENEVDTAYSSEGDTVFFGYDIYVKSEPSKSLGYEFTANPLGEMKSDIGLYADKLPAFTPSLLLENHAD